MKELKRERIDKILCNSGYQTCMELNGETEKERQFCRHDMGHFLDVARIAQILNLQEESQVEDELIYAAALLHDIGRYVQYEDGTAHEKASVALALPILAECGFDDKETDVILKAIAGHRIEESAQERGLDGLLYRADKLSRSCFACKAESACDWKEGKKNKHLTW